MSQELFSASVGEVGSFLLAAAAVAAGLSLLTPPGEAGHLDAAAAGSTTALTAGGAAGDKVIGVLPTVKPPDGLAGLQVSRSAAKCEKVAKWPQKSCKDGQVSSFERVEQIGLSTVKAAHRLYMYRESTSRNSYCNKIYRWVTTLLSYTRSRSTKNIMLHVVIYDLFSSMISTTSIQPLHNNQSFIG